MGKGGGGSTQTTSNAPPQYIQDAQQAGINIGQGLSAPFLGQAPMYATAGFTPDQQAAFQLARQYAVQPQQDYAGAAIATGSRPDGVDPRMALQAGQPANAMTAASLRLPGMMTEQAGNMGNVNMGQYMNPYQREAIDAAMGDLRRQNDQTMAGIGAQAARAGSFGGSRHAILESEQNRNFTRTAADTSARMRHQGYDQASQLAQSDLNRRLQALQFGVGQSFSGLGNAANIGLNAVNTAAGIDRGNRGMDLNAIQAAGGLASQQQADQMRALQMLLGTGQMQQSQAQQSLDVPFNRLNQLMGMVNGGNYGQSQTTSQNPGTLNTIGTIAQAAGTLIPLFSDRRLKADVERIGALPSGLPTYRYRYVWDEPGTVREGVMAQEAAEVFPEAVFEVGGYLAVDYGRIA